jgi:hypothetical protein
MNAETHGRKNETERTGFTGSTRRKNPYPENLVHPVRKKGF